MVPCLCFVPCVACVPVLVRCAEHSGEPKVQYDRHRGEDMTMKSMGTRGRGQIRSRRTDLLQPAHLTSVRCINASRST